MLPSMARDVRGRGGRRGWLAPTGPCLLIVTAKDTETWVDYPLTEGLERAGANSPAIPTSAGRGQ